MIGARPAALVWGGLFVCSLSAQNVAVFPSDHATRDGVTYSSNLPLAYGISRVMAVYESWDLTIPNGARITQLGFRQDESVTTSMGYQIQLEVWMGQSTRTAATVSSNYADNYATTPVQVVNRRIIALPNLVPTPRRDVTITLDTPYTFNRNNNLVVEYRVFANSNSNQSFPYYLDRASHYSPVTTFGTACAGSGGRLPSLQSSPSYIGSTWFVNLSNAPASSFVILDVDFSSTTPVPGAPFGAPGCTLLVQPFAPLPTMTNAGGGASWSANIPNNLAFYQATIYSQALIADLFANTLGYVSSNGTTAQLGALPRMSFVYSQGDATATTGSISYNDGTISLFTYQ